MKQTLPLLAAAAAFALSACATEQPAPEPQADPQAEFMAALNGLCGNAYEGRVVTNEEADSDFASNRLVMHVRECAPDDVRIPFHVGENRSRTWVITRTAEGLRLKHDHRHEDGSEDAVTQYGGDTANAGTATRQEFPVDQFSRDLFVAQDLPQSVDNVWAVEVIPGQTYAYELRRPNRFLRVEFDLTRPVEAPPAPWGHE